LHSLGLRKPTKDPATTLFESWSDASAPIAPAACLPARALLLDAISSDVLCLDVTRYGVCELCRRGQRQELLSACSTRRVFKSYKKRLQSDANNALGLLFLMESKCGAIKLKEKGVGKRKG
jgi:hypothetical protein